MTALALAVIPLAADLVAAVRTAATVLEETLVAQVDSTQAIPMAAAAVTTRAAELDVAATTHTAQPAALVD